MLSRLRRIVKNQRGFTLVELLVAVSIVGVISGPLSMSVWAMMKSPGQTSAHMTVVKQLERAIHEVTRDVQMAQVVIPDDGASGFPLTLQWFDWDSAAENTVVYALENGGLTRSYTFGGDTTSTIVGQYIASDSDKTKCEYDGGVFKLTITAEITGSIAAHESRVVKIVPRTNL